MKAGRRLAALSLGAVMIVAVDRAEPRDAEPLPVRYPEGVLHGFLVLRGEDGTALAQGDLLQVPREGRIHSRMKFRFRDGSAFDERVTYSQRDVFTLHRYRLTQRGPSFEENAEIDLVREAGRYEITVRGREDGEAKTERGTIELPADVYNGMPILLAKNLVPTDTEAGFVIEGVPAFVRFQGPLSMTGRGPVRTIELALPEWAGAQPETGRNP